MTAASLSRKVLFSLATNERFEAAARSLPPVEQATRKRAFRYVAGERSDDAFEVTQRLYDAGLMASIDFFGEQVSKEDEARRVADAYVTLARRLDETPPATSIALDLSHVGLDISEVFARTQLERIVEALPAGRRIDVGAEDCTRTDRTLAIVRAVARAGASLQMTLQANLRRSAADWRGIVDSGAAIRLVKGAYVEPPALAYPYGAETGAAYARLARELHAAGAKLALGTHDAVLRDSLLEELEGLDVEMLLGVREEDARALARRGVAVRIYVPYGEGWFRYWMRRVAEARGA